MRTKADQMKRLSPSVLALLEKIKSKIKPGTRGAAARMDRYHTIYWHAQTHRSNFAGEDNLASIRVRAAEAPRHNRKHENFRFFYDLAQKNKR